LQQDEADEHLFMVPNGYKKMAEEYKAKAKDSSVEHSKMKEGHTVCPRNDLVKHKTEPFSEII
jgi:hypothetical protein